MFGGIWHHLHGQRWAADASTMSPEERRLASESVEDQTADRFVAEQLGGIDPARLLEDDEPHRT